MEEKVVLSTADEAATYRTDIKGWVDRHGRFCGDGAQGERAARYSSCTHVACETCGEIHRRSSYCRPCSERRRTERCKAMPKKKWNGKGMLHSDSADEYFNDWYEVESYCLEHDCTPESLDLIICEPVYPCPIEEDYWSEELGEDGSVKNCDATLAYLVKMVNAYIEERKPVFSWTPGEYAVDLSEEA